MKKISFYKIRSIVCAAIATVMALTVCMLCACGKTPTDTEKSAIKSVTAIGFMDLDGVKLKAIAVEYEQDMSGANVAKDTYKISVTKTIPTSEIGNGAIGDITAVYVNDEVATSEAGGSGSGKYVIIEVFTDYMASDALSYEKTMSAKVTQLKDITLGNGTVIAASDTAVANTFGSKNSALNFVIPEIEGFKFYTNDGGDYGADGPAWTVQNCYNQQDGKYYNINLSYALCLPKDYSEDGHYAMVTLQNPAAAAGTHPLTSVLAYRSAAVYASDWAQQLVKESHEGIDGLIVVVPVVTARVDDNGGTPAEYEAIVSLWDHVIETYHVDENYIYGSGQSVGGMIVLETNRNRDNFFAGILLYDNQWTQNYYPDTIFTREMAKYPETTGNTAEMHYPRTDSNITWDYHYAADGSKVTVADGHDPYNYYYLISDDNIMITNSAGGGLSNDTWREMKYLYSDLVGYDFRQHIVDASKSLDEQNEDVWNWTQRTDDALNLNWVSFDGGSTSRKLEACYKWLLTQDRQTAMSREKLDLNKPFATADEQIKTEDRAISFTDAEGGTIYYQTGRQGAGTRGYCSYWGNTGTIADAIPGWLPDGMSWETGVGFATIQNVTSIGNNAIAIEYDVDMSNLVINLKGDKVYNHLIGEYRENDFIILDPFEFFDADGNKIECSIKKVYLNDSAAVADTENKQGSGRYLIIEFNDASTATIAGMIQRTTVRTDRVFANAYPWTYEVK